MDKLKGILKDNPNIGLDEDTIAVATSSFSNQTKRISLRGGVFRKIVGGKEVSTADSSEMNIVIMKMAHTPSRSYYKDTYEEGKKVSPVFLLALSQYLSLTLLLPQQEKIKLLVFVSLHQTPSW